MARSNPLLRTHHVVIETRADMAPDRILGSSSILRFVTDRPSPGIGGRMVRSTIEGVNMLSNIQFFLFLSSVRHFPGLAP
jgi:hypothetical protein